MWKSCETGNRGALSVRRLPAFYLCFPLALAITAWGQVKVGNDLNLNLNGQLSAGYTGDFGNYISSDHTLTFGGNANITGYYFNPDFLSFSINPFYNQSRANSASRSDLDSSGINVAASIFSGTHFPGSVTYGKTFSHSGIFGVPGVPDYTTHGTSDIFTIGWGVNIPDYPSVSVNFQDGHDHYSLYGQNNDNSTAFHTFSVRSLYDVAGFHLNGGFQLSGSSSVFPLLGSEQPDEGKSNTHSFFVGVGHALPWHGGASANYNRSYFDASSGIGIDSLSSRYSGNSDNLSGGLYFNPVTKLNVGLNITYTDNLFGTLYQPIVDSGAVVQSPGQSAHSLDMTGFANYQINKHLKVTSTVEERTQNYWGGSISSRTFTGLVGYTNELWGGVISVLSGITASQVDTADTGTSIGVVNSVSFSREVGGWGIAGSLNYNQNTQTALAGYTTSDLGYGAHVSHKLGLLHWTAVASGSKTLLNNSGYSNFIQSYSTSLAGRWFGVNGSYSKSDGNALLVNNNLVQAPLPQVLLPNQLISYGGTGWGLGVGSSPIRGLTLSAGYSQSLSRTINSDTFSNNHNQSFVATAQYHWRQLYFNGGYTRIVQGFSASPTPPANVNSFYFGIQRFFDFF